MQTVITVLFAKAHHPRAIHRHHKPAFEQAVLMQHLLLQQRLHQGVFELFQLGVGKPTQHPMHRVQVGQP